MAIDYKKIQDRIEQGKIDRDRFIRTQIDVYKEYTALDFIQEVDTTPYSREIITKLCHLDIITQIDTENILKTMYEWDLTPFCQEKETGSPINIQAVKDILRELRYMDKEKCRRILAQVFIEACIEQYDVNRYHHFSGIIEQINPFSLEIIKKICQQDYIELLKTHLHDQYSSTGVMIIPTSKVLQLQAIHQPVSHQKSIVLYIVAHACNKKTLFVDSKASQQYAANNVTMISNTVHDSVNIEDINISNTFRYFKNNVLDDPSSIQLYKKEKEKEKQHDNEVAYRMNLATLLSHLPVRINDSLSNEKQSLAFKEIRGRHNYFLSGPEITIERPLLDRKYDFTDTIHKETGIYRLRCSDHTENRIYYNYFGKQDIFYEREEAKQNAQWWGEGIPFGWFDALYDTDQFTEFFFDTIETKHNTILLSDIITWCKDAGYQHVYIIDGGCRINCSDKLLRTSSIVEKTPPLRRIKTLGKKSRRSFHKRK